jgi:hypothetical protein
VLKVAPLLNVFCVPHPFRLSTGACRSPFLTTAVAGSSVWCENPARRAFRGSLLSILALWAGDQLHRRGRL